MSELTDPPFDTREPSLHEGSPTPGPATAEDDGRLADLIDVTDRAVADQNSHMKRGYGFDGGEESYIDDQAILCDLIDTAKYLRELQAIRSSRT